MNRYVRICTTRERLRATLRIENFSVYLRKGVFSSPVLETESKQSKWSFSVLAEDGDDYANFISVRLKNEDCETGELCVEATVSMLDCFGLEALEEEKKVVFNRSHDAQIFAVAKNQMSKYYSLNRQRFIPNDVLTLQCDMVIHTDEILHFSTKEEFDENLRLYRSPDLNNVSEYFVYSHITKQAFDFTRRVDNFSVRACKGRFVCPDDYQSEISNDKWNLVLYVDDSDFQQDFLSIALSRRGVKGELAEVKLSVLDDSGNTLLSAEKLLYFINSMEGKVLSFTKQDKERLIPNDTLNLKCEVSLCKENAFTFTTKEEFESSIQSHESCDDGYLSRMKIYAFLIFFGVTLAMLGALDYAVPFIWKIMGAVAKILVSLYQWVRDLVQIILYCLEITKKPPSTNIFVRFFEQRSGFMYRLFQIAFLTYWNFKNVLQKIGYLFSMVRRNNSQSNRALSTNSNEIVPYGRHEVVTHGRRNYDRMNYTHAYDPEGEFYPHQRNRNYRY